MKYKTIILITFFLILSSLTLFTACEDNGPSALPEEAAEEAPLGDEEELDATEGEELDDAAAEDMLAQVQAYYEQIKEMLNDLLYSMPRVVHDRNLRTIDQAVELFKLMEGGEPASIGASEEAGTLLGEGYLDGVPKVPAMLQEEEGPWSAYTLQGDPLRSWPVGDWGGYRDGDMP